MGGKETASGEGKERVREKVVKLEGWGREGKWTEVKAERKMMREKVELCRKAEGKVRRRMEEWGERGRNKKQKSIFSAGIRTSVGGQGMLRLAKTLYTPTMIRTPVHTHTHMRERTHTHTHTCIT